VIVGSKRSAIAWCARITVGGRTSARAREVLSERVGQAPQRSGGTQGAASAARDRAASIDRRQVRDRTASAAAGNRDNALRGARNAAQVRQQVDRGAASQARQQRSRRERGNVSRPAAGPSRARRR